MNAKLFLLTNAVLFCLVVGFTVRMLGRDPHTRYKEMTLPEVVSRDSQGMAAGGGGVTRPARPRRGMRDSDVTSLWQDTLFNPDRTEAVDNEGEGEEDPKPPPPSDMELIGIGVINKDAAALILLRQSRPTSRRRVGRPPTSVAGAATEKPTQTDEERNPKRHVFRKGDEVADTGWVVEEIELASVTLRRNEEERVLELDTGDSASTGRNTAAAAESARALATTAPKPTPKPAATPPETPKRTPTRTPPPPPPPPPGAGGAGGPPIPGGDAQSKSERIRRALEARRRLLEARRNKSNDDDDE